MRNIFLFIFAKNVTLSFSGQSSEFEDYYSEGSSEGSTEGSSTLIDYQGSGRRIVSYSEVRLPDGRRLVTAPIEIRAKSPSNIRTPLYQNVICHQYFVVNPCHQNRCGH